MLVALSIENFAIVKQLELDLAQGMTAFTGETGAGKSIIIDALMLILGGRADVTVVRPETQKCELNAVFHIDEHSEPAEWLLQQDIDSDAGELIIRRVLTLEGRSKSYINGRPYPLQKVRELGELLVHIHGQHEYQALMQHASHRIQLDNYAQHDALIVHVSDTYKKCQKIMSELKDLQNQDKNQDRLALLEFQLEELKALHIQEGEMQALNEEHQHLHHAKDYLHCIQEISLLLGGDEKGNICQQLNQAIQLAHSLPIEKTSVKNTLEFLENALIQSKEAEDEIQRFAEQVLLDPERLNQVETRLSLVHSIARKHHVDVNQLLSHTNSLENELETLKNRDLTIKHLEQAYEALMRVYEKAAKDLTESRKKYALELGREISAIIQQLGMPKGYVTLEISPLEKGQAHGLDKVEYKVTTNPGMPPDALGKIASGGELSRIGLAIQMITAQNGATPTLIFDEVDVGIGGATAALVGQLLRNLGERLQLFCVTHQAQVAACAHHHFVVEKYSDHKETYSSIIPVKQEEKIDEIARMLGGLTITEQTRSHAKELVEHC